MKSVSKGSEPIKRGKDSWFSRFNVTDELGNTKRVGKTVRAAPRPRQSACSTRSAWI